MQIYQNVGSARLAERAVLVLDRTMTPSMTRPVARARTIRMAALQDRSISSDFKLHMCNLKSEMCNLKKMPNRLKSSYLKRRRTSNCTLTKIFYVQFEI